ncbi:uncharacterized protein LOC113291442 [Papaver somniferum]|uniref:uncharacterized protein LOC113291442 n=1 Tax=Papaver somniferum TaxID=3469 RepID=UPI000E6FF2EC|nr:uncharacterized protein LOC113291442 [Papaver somniferum]
MKVGGNASAILQKKLPLKCKYPASFDIPIVTGNTKFNKAMLDLGASVNVMPASIYESLKLGPLKETRITLQLVDRSNVYHRGIIEDVLVQAPKLELKPLPDHLKYLYFGEKEELPVIVSKELTELQEQRLLRVLRLYKTAI